MSDRQDIEREAVEQGVIAGCPHGTPEQRWCPDCSDERRCEGCDKVRPHTILRLNVTGKPVLCDGCHAERTNR